MEIHSSHSKQREAQFTMRRLTFGLHIAQINGVHCLKCQQGCPRVLNVAGRRANSCKARLVPLLPLQPRGRDFGTPAVLGIRCRAQAALQQGKWQYNCIDYLSVKVPPVMTAGAVTRC